jgi:CRISPR-associated protein Csb1
LRDAVSGDGIGVRAKIPLEPLGGPGDKIFPPSYSVSPDASSRYATEKRRVGGESVTAVVLDSVASQANRMESALLDAYRNGELALPLVSVDFGGIEGVEGFDRISSLDASHRIFDAILRDSLLGDDLFRLSDIGQAITEASTKDAAAMFRHAPSALVFGAWDSTGPKGGKGAKYERAITSEIVGIGVELGTKSSSRIDTVGIELKAGPLYAAADGSWTLEESEAIMDGKKAVLYKRSGEGTAGRPSQANHGNITPSLDRMAGGVTVDRIEATTVLSFVQLRRLRFPRDTSGQPLAGEQRRVAESAARTALAALGLAATVLAFDDGFDLRSRCVLVADGDLSFELLRRGSAPSTRFSLDRQEALDLLATARSEAESAGLSWEPDELLLRPAKRLVELVRRSQRIERTESEDA